MRKLIVFLVFMNLLLFGGGQYLNASTLSHHHNLEHKHRVKFTSQDRGSSVIEDADIDLEEDLLGGGDDINLLTNKYFTASYSLVDILYLALSDQSAANDSNRFKISTPVFGHSNPIYITQRVLRI